MPLLLYVQLSIALLLTILRVNHWAYLLGILILSSGCISEQEVLTQSLLRESNQEIAAEVRNELTEVQSSTTSQNGWCSKSRERGRRANRQGVISALSINQALEIPLLVEGQSQETSLPVIVGRQALVEVQVDWYGEPAQGSGVQLLLESSGQDEQVFVELMDTTQAPAGAVSAPLTLPASQNEPTNVNPDARASVEVIRDAEELLFIGEPVARTSFFIQIPKGALYESTRLAFSLFEEGDCDGRLGLAGSSYPRDGFLSLPLQKTGALEVMIVPIRYWADGSGRLPDLDDADLQVLSDMVEAMFPVPQVNFTIHEVVETQESEISSILTQVIDLREAEAPQDNVAYFGFVNPAENMDAYCGDNCVAGVSVVGNDSGRSSTGVGVGFRGKAHETFLHELGHIFQLGHAPCGEPDQTDENFPHLDAKIGVNGYDFRSDSILLADGENRDFMSYCDPSWISDYHYRKLATSISLTNGLVQADIHSSGGDIPSPEESVFFLEDSNGLLKRLNAMHPAVSTRGQAQAATFVSAEGETKEIIIWVQEISEEAGFIFQVNETDLPSSQGDFIRLPSGAALYNDARSVEPFSKRRY